MKVKNYFTTGDIAKQCQVSAVAVFKWIKAGKLKAHTTPGGHHRIARKDLVEFLQTYGMPIPPELAEATDKILIVDDERMVVDTLSRALSQAESKYEIATASNGYEACIKIGTMKPDLIVLDIMMEGIDGFEVCKRAKSNPETSHAKVLVLTGYAEPENINRMMACGADDWIAKPFEVDVLRERVRELLDSKANAKSAEA